MNIYQWLWMKFCSIFPKRKKANDTKEIHMRNFMHNKGNKGAPYFYIDASSKCGPDKLPL